MISEAFGSRMTFAMIQGGHAVNIVPDYCETTLDVRVVPECNRTMIEDIFYKTIKQIKKTDEEFAIEYKYLTGQNGYLLNIDNPLLESLQKSIQKITKQEPALVAHGPAHSGNLWNHHKIPIIVKGPIGGNTHSYDEYVEIDSIPQTAEIYARTILEYFKIVF